MDDPRLDTPIPAPPPGQGQGTPTGSTQWIIRRRTAAGRTTLLDVPQAIGGPPGRHLSLPAPAAWNPVTLGHTGRLRLGRPGCLYGHKAINPFLGGSGTGETYRPPTAQQPPTINTRRNPFALPDRRQTPRPSRLTPVPPSPPLPDAESQCQSLTPPHQQFPAHGELPTTTASWAMAPAPSPVQWRESLLNSELDDEEDMFRTARPRA